MYTLKGFATIGSLTDNNDHVVSPLGELSPKGYSYARDKKHYSLSDPQYQGVSFSAFMSEDETGPVSVPDTHSILTVELIAWMYTEARAGKFTSDPQSFQRAFVDKWGNDITLLVSGPMVSAQGIFLPTTITCKYENYSPNEIVLWFSDDSFRSQYDGYRIEVVPAILPVSVFKGTANQVREANSRVDQTEVQERCLIAAGGYPYTVQRSDMFEWTDQYDPQTTVPVYFHTVINGEAGNNIDAVKEAIKDYLRRETGMDDSELAPIFPGLWSSTEFIVAPLWKNIAIPNLTVETGIYSGGADLSKIMPYANKAIQGVDYTTQHVADNLQIIATNYKSLQCIVVGGPENVRSVSKFLSMFPDYTSLSSDHPDFGRMSVKTRQLVLMLVDMYRISETTFTNTPIGYTRVVRNGVVYLARTFDRVQYLVAIRDNNL